MEQIEFLLAQSLGGMHHLFAHESVKEILSRPTEHMDFFNGQNMSRIRALFAQLLEQKSVTEKLSFVHGLDHSSYEILLRTYFHIVDTTLQALKIQH